MKDEYELIKIERPAEQTIVFDIPTFLEAYGTAPFVSWAIVQLKFIINNEKKSVQAQLIANNAYVLWRGETAALYEQLIGSINVKHVVEFTTTEKKEI